MHAGRSNTRLREVSFLLLLLVMLLSLSGKLVFRSVPEPVSKQKSTSVSKIPKAVNPGRSQLLFRTIPSVVHVLVPGKTDTRKIQQVQNADTSLRITRYQQKRSVIDIEITPWYQHYYFPGDEDEYTEIS